MHVQGRRPDSVFQNALFNVILGIRNTFFLHSFHKQPLQDKAAKYKVRERCGLCKVGTTLLYTMYINFSLRSVK